MGKKSDPPPPPDYTAAAQAQGDASKELTTQQTFANRPTINTPFGSQTWNTAAGTDPATGLPITEWTQNVNLTPQLEQALGGQMDIQNARTQTAQGMLGQMSDQFGQPIDFSGLPQAPALPGATGQVNLQRSLNMEGLPGMPGNAEDTRNRVEDALYQRHVRRLDPQFQREQGSLETQLANQGLTRGSEAWNNAAQDFGNRKEDAYERAMLESILAGGQEATRDFGMDLQRRQQGYNETLGAGNFANSAGVSQANLDNQQFGQGIQSSEAAMRQRQQMLSEMMTQRGFSLNEINALLSGQQVGMPSMPTFNTAGVSQTPQYLQAAGQQYGAAMDSYNAEQAGINSMMSGIFGLGKAAIPFML